jgi:hypothetical protein
MSPTDKIARLYPQENRFPFVAFYNLQRIQWRYSNLPPHGGVMPCSLAKIVTMFQRYLLPPSLNLKMVAVKIYQAT